MRRSVALMLFMCFLDSISTGQTTNVAGVFPTIDHSGKIAPEIEYSLYYFGAFPLVQFTSDGLKGDSYFNLFYAEQAFTYQTSQQLSFTGSYTFQKSNVFQENAVNENRFYVQGKYKQHVGQTLLSHRIRFDGRFIQDPLTRKAPFTHRLRYLIGLEIPINEKNYFTAYEEPFFNTFKKADRIYGENWLYAAFGKRLNEQNKLELGVLYVTWNMGSNDWFNQYYFQFTWINHLDFTEKKQQNE